MKHSIGWAEASLGLYWIVTAGLLVGAGGSSPEALRLAVFQLLAAAGLFCFSTWCDARPDQSPTGPWPWVRLSPWPVLLMWTYKNIEVVQNVLGLPFLDAQLQAWDQAIWGFSPAMEWSLRWNWLWFSEFLHFCYLTYMLNFAILIIRQVREGGIHLARVALGGGGLSLVLCFCGNCLCPALGPRHLLPPLADALHGPFWRLCHFLSKDGAAAAAAFPSGHCALSTATLILAWHLDRRRFPIYAIWSIGTLCSTVYGRFHYSVDSFAGMLIGCAGAAIVLRSQAAARKLNNPEP